MPHETTVFVRSERVAKRKRSIVDWYNATDPFCWSYNASRLGFEFVLSPLGWGYDCFRNFEALATGTIPIVQSVGPWSEHFARAQLPVALDESNYTELSLRQLNAWHARMAPLLSQVTSEAKLNTSYWWRHMWSIARASATTPRKAGSTASPRHAATRAGAGNDRCATARAVAACSQCPNAAPWMDLVAPLNASPRMTFYNIGANKGYNVNEFLQRHASGWSVSNKM